jgi:hypothetical protein
MAHLVGCCVCVCYVLCFVLPPKKSSVLECHHISYFENEIMSYVFWWVPTFVDQITTGKKVQSSGRQLEKISDNHLSCQKTTTTNHTLI